MYLIGGINGPFGESVYSVAISGSDVFAGTLVGVFASRNGKGNPFLRFFRSAYFILTTSPAAFAVDTRMLDFRSTTLIETQ